MKRRGLRKRYGRAWPSLSAITQPAGHGLVNVVLVDGRGTPVQTLGRGITRARARQIIRERHG